MSAAPAVLFVGGTADGRWLTIPPDAQLYRVPVPSSVLSFADLTDGPSIVVHDYYVERFAAFGRSVRIAVLTTLRADEREDAVIRALFQRDMATELTRGK